MTRALHMSTFAAAIGYCLHARWARVIQFYHDLWVYATVPEI